MKNCKSKGLRMATGGVLEESAALRHRMAEKYGVTTGDEAAQAPSQPQAPTGQAQPTQPKQGGLRGLLSSFQRHFDQVDKAANMAKGGIVVGKHSDAPKDSERREKARTADQVPVNLSIDEAVLPAKTVDALGGPEAVEELIEQTNGKEPVTKGLRAGGNYADGSSGFMRSYNPSTDDPENVGRARQQTIDSAKGAIGNAGSFMPDTRAVFKGVGEDMTDAYSKAGGGLAGWTAAALKGLKGSTAYVPAVANDVLGPVVNPIAKGLVDGATVAATDQPIAKPGQPVASPAAKSPESAPAEPASATTPANPAAFNPETGTTRFKTRDDATSKNFDMADGTGIMTRSPGKDGLRQAIVMGPGKQFDENGMDATDRKYAAAGYGKDAYGNWMTPARQALDKQYADMKAGQAAATAGGPSVVSTGGTEADRLQKQLEWDRFGTPSIMERDGIGAAMRMQRQNSMAQEIGQLRGQDNQLKIAQMHNDALGQERQMRREDRALDRDTQLKIAGLRGQLSPKDVFEMQREMGKDRQAAYNTQQATQQGNYKMIQEALDRMFPTQGLKDDALAATQAQRAAAERAFMAANGGNMPTDQGEFQRALPGMLAQADLTGAINHTVANPSVMDRLSNLFHGNFDRTVGDAAVVPKMLDDGKTMQLPNGLRIDTKKVIGNSADRAAALNSRLAQAQAQLGQQ